MTMIVRLRALTKKGPTTDIIPRTPVARPRKAVLLLKIPVSMTKPSTRIPTARVSEL